MEAVLKSKLFVSTSLAGNDPKEARAAEHTSARIVLPFPTRKVPIAHRHEVGFYSHDRRLLDDVRSSSEQLSRRGTIVIATEPHRDDLLQRLQTYGLDIGAAIEQGRYIALDAADALPAFMLRGTHEPARFLKVLGELVSTAAAAVEGNRGRVSIFGEMWPCPVGTG